MFCHCFCLLPQSLFLSVLLCLTYTHTHTQFPRDTARPAVLKRVYFILSAVTDRHRHYGQETGQRASEKNSCMLKKKGESCGHDTWRISKRAIFQQLRQAMCFIMQVPPVAPCLLQIYFTVNPYVH